VPRLAVRRDGGDPDRAVLVTDVVRLVQDRGSGGRGVLDALVDVGHLQGEVDHTVTVQPVMIQDRAVRGHAAAEHEPGRPRSQHVLLVVTQPGLRPGVRNEVHPERQLVELGGLGRVADNEDDRVHRGHREGVQSRVVVHQPDELLELVERELGLLLLRGEDLCHARSMM
jgi:hypothetical protein